MTTLEHLPYHKRFFSTSDPPSKLVFGFRQLTAFVSSLSSALFTYLFRGPTHREWNLTYHLANIVLVAIIKANRGGPLSKTQPDFNHIQQRSLDMKPRKIKDVFIVEESFSPQAKVIAFIKSRIAESNWPAGVADDADVVIEADWIAHKDAPEEKIILHLHGGGYVQLSNKTHRPMTALISSHSGCRVFSVNYRLAPQNPFPCGLIDAVSAYLHLLEKFKPENIVLMGDSAGGGLALACAMVIRDMDLQQPAAVYLQSPWVDLTHTVSKRSLEVNAVYDYVIGGPHDHRKGIDRLHYYCPNDLLRHPYVSPYWGTFDKLPPLFIHGGSAERLYDEIEELAEKAASQSDNAVVFHSYLHHVHVFPFFFAINKACTNALKVAGEWISTSVREKVSLPPTKFTTYDFRGIPLSERVFAADKKTLFIRLLQ